MQTFAEYTAENRNCAIIVDDIEWAKNWAATQGNDSRSRALTIPFKFLDFDAGVGEEYKPKYDANAVMGRHAPYLAYIGGSLRVIKFSALLIDEDVRGQSLTYARLLQGLTLPWRKEGDVTTRKPPTVLLSIFPKTFMLLRGVLKTVGKVSTSPLIQPTKSGAASFTTTQPPDEGFGSGFDIGLISGNVAVDIEFISTETAENHSIDVFLDSGYAQFASKTPAFYNEARG